MLTVPVLPCPTEVIVPGLSLLVIRNTDHDADGCQPGEGSRRALSTLTCTHTIKLTHTSTVLHAQINGSKHKAEDAGVSFNDKLQSKPTRRVSTVLWDPWDL